MLLSHYHFDGSQTFNMKQMPTNGKKDHINKKEILEKTQKNLEKISLLQKKLYAQSEESIIILFQALDAAGKDSTIKKVMQSMDPQGIDVFSFKQPSSVELSHDFLWRTVKVLPSRGKIAIFNRSYYEDVLIVKVHNLHEHFKMPKRITENSRFYEKRYEQIVNFETYLYENGYRVIKILLNISPEEQKKRLLERIDNPEKNWKHSAGDLEERKLWNEYQNAFESMVNHTSTSIAPWYVIPADQKWYSRYLVSEALLHALENIDPTFPTLSAESIAKMQLSKTLLESD